MMRRVPIKIDPPDSEEWIVDGKVFRRLTATYRINILGTWWRFPIYEIWNQASVPRLLRIITDEQELSDCGTLGHDKLYEYKGKLPLSWLEIGQTYRTYTRDEADLYLHQIALLCGCAPWRVNLSIPVMRAFQGAREIAGLAPKW